MWQVTMYMRIRCTAVQLCACPWTPGRMPFRSQHYVACKHEVHCDARMHVRLGDRQVPLKFRVECGVPTCRVDWAALSSRFCRAASVMNPFWKMYCFRTAGSAICTPQTSAARVKKRCNA